jgi:hypothetical protein
VLGMQGLGRRREAWVPGRAMSVRWGWRRPRRRRRRCGVSLAPGRRARAGLFGSPRSVRDGWERIPRRPLLAARTLFSHTLLHKEQEVKLEV